MRWSTVVFDFDQTIADTSRLKTLREEARRTQDWRPYIDTIHRAPPVLLGNKGTALDLVKATKEAGLKVAIASRSSGRPIKRWLSYHNLDLRVFPAIGENRSGLRQIAESFAIDPGETVFVDDEYSGIKAAHNLGWLTATTQPTVSASYPPDMWLLDPEALTHSHKPGRLIGYFEDSRDPGVLYAGASQLVLGGNYFPKRWRIPHEGSLTRKILETKDGWPWPNDLKSVVRQLVEAAVVLTGERNVILTGIPPRRDTDDRFHHVLLGAAKALGIFYSTLLDFSRPVERQIDTRDRRSNLVNSMVSKPVNSATVIVFDDITTSGSTFTEAGRALMAAGADRVVNLALAKTANLREQPKAVFTSLRELQAARPDWLTAQIAPPEPKRRRRRSGSSAGRIVRSRPFKIPDDYVSAGDIQQRSAPRRILAPPTLIEITLDLSPDQSPEAQDLLFESSEAEIMSVPQNLYLRMGAPARITAQLANEGFRWRMEPTTEVFPIGWLTEEGTVLKSIPQSGYELELLLSSTTLAKARDLVRVKLRLVVGTPTPPNQQSP